MTLGLGPVLDRFRSARSQAETLLAVAAIGLLACALANLGLLGALTYERRPPRPRSRVCAAPPRAQSSVCQLVEAALIAVPAGVLGWALAILTIDARGSSLSGWLAAAVVGGTLCCSSRRSRASRDARSGRSRRRTSSPSAGGAAGSRSKAWSRSPRSWASTSPAPRRRQLRLRGLGPPRPVSRRGSRPPRTGLRDRGAAPPSISRFRGLPRARPPHEGPRAPARPRPRRAATGHHVAPGARARRRARDRGVLGRDGEHDSKWTGGDGRARDRRRRADRRGRRLEPAGGPRHASRRGAGGSPGPTSRRPA